MDETEKENHQRAFSEGVAPADPDWVEQTFLLPFPPSVNNLFSHNKSSGKRFVSDRYKQWRTEAGWALRSQNPQPMTGRVRITIIAIKPDKKRRDIDNIAKAPVDLLVEHSVIEDDSCVDLQTVAWSSSNLSGISVTVTGTVKPKTNR